MNDWTELNPALCSALEPQVLVTVLATRGSAPRGAGTRMLVSRNGTVATIGGGHLEYQSIALARTWLDSDTDGPCRRVERFPLGARLGQCCGGVVQVCFERIAPDTPWVAGLRKSSEAGESGVLVTPDDATPSLFITASHCYGALPPGAAGHRLVRSARQLLGDRSAPTPALEHGYMYERLGSNAFHVLLFGAGHVGRAVVQVLSSLPVRIDWIDSRDEAFPVHLPANVHPVVDDAPEDQVDDAAAGSYVLIMTHSHAIDQRICQRALTRTDFSYVGLIGSLAKRRRFERRLKDRGIGAAALASLVCPVGIGGISGKHPGEIAVSIVAELLQTRERLVVSSPAKLPMIAEGQA